MIEFIPATRILAALKNTNRQYLAGDLKLPQELTCIFDKNVDVGITKYTKYTAEQPHSHRHTVEYTYVLEGETKFIDLSARQEFFFRKGDFFIVRNNTLTVQKSLGGTILLAVKVPGGNDKLSIAPDDSVRAWCESWGNVFYSDSRDL
jgi:mannose-6-phosphate isomerase-like protein (cupin superfamily)